MTNTPSLPILGASLNLTYLEKYKSWMQELPRDLELIDFVYADVLMNDWSPLAEQTKKQIDGLEGRIGIHGPFSGFSLKTSDPEVQTIVRKRLDQGLEVCRAVGADCMVLHSPYTYWDHHNMENKSNPGQKLLENCHATMTDAVKKAEDMGCTIVLENIEDINPEYRKQLMESFNSPALSLSIDTGHAHYAHCSYQAPPVDYFIKSAGNKLAHIHIQDVDGYADRHWVPGQGTIPWRAVFKELAKLESNPRLIIELADLDEVPEAAKWLKDHGLAL